MNRSDLQSANDAFFEIRHAARVLSRAATILRGCGDARLKRATSSAVTAHLRAQALEKRVGRVVESLKAKSGGGA